MNAHLPRALSLRTRLALWYLLILGAVFVISGALTYMTVRNLLLEDVDQALAAHVQTVMAQLSSKGNSAVYLGRRVIDNDSEQAVYLFDARGQVRDVILGSGAVPPHPELVRAALHDPTGYSTVGNLRFYSAVLHDAQGRVSGVLQAVETLSVAQGDLDDLLRVLTLTSPLLLAIATLGGIFLAGRALAPIDHMRQLAQEIRAGTLSERLGFSPRNDEVGRLAATFDDMLGRLENAFAQQRQFVADASHELRTPLTIIKGDIEVLLRRQRPSTEYEEVLRGVNEEVVRLGTLVDNLLVLARADSGQQELAQELVYLDTLVEDVARTMQRLARAGTVTLETHLQREILIVGDSGRLRQLVSNLLDNAIKYTPAGGRVEVTLRERVGWAYLEVADTGQGISAADLPHIFQRFFRADPSRERREGGTGLGLAIAQWCAAAHGGQIEARSTLGTGSVFSVALPLALLDRSVEDTVEARRESALAGQRTS